MREIIIITSSSSIIIIIIIISTSSSIAVVIICLSVIDLSLCSSSGPAHLLIVGLIRESARCGREGVSRRHLFEYICSVAPTAPGAGEGPPVEITAHLKDLTAACQREDEYLTGPTLAVLIKRSTLKALANSQYCRNTDIVQQF